MLGAACGLAGALICAAAAFTHHFWLLCAGAWVLGIYNATGQYYRFAAADSVGANFKSMAISLVLAGGIAGGVLGPETSKITKDLIAEAIFTGSYLSLGVFCLIAMAPLSRNAMLRPSAPKCRAPTTSPSSSRWRQVRCHPACCSPCTGGNS